MRPRRHDRSSRQRQTWSRVLLGAVAALVGACAAARVEPAVLERYSYAHAAMGTRFDLTLYAFDRESARTAALAAFDRIDAIEAVATDYDASSEARELCRRAIRRWVPVSPDLAAVLRASDRAVRTSEGAFDPTVGPMTRLWRRALRERRWPTAERWERARAQCGWIDLVELRDAEGGLEVRLLETEMRLDFGGVAKGVAVDEALARLVDEGIEHAQMDGGGDLAALEPPPDEEGWRIAVEPTEARPASFFLLARGAIATSGDRFQSAELSGTPPAGLTTAATQYGHVLDPRVGLPLPSPRAAVMTAPNAAEADAYATARLVLGSIRTGVPALERGVFYGPFGEEPCVGTAFPHDGATPVEPEDAEPDAESEEPDDSPPAR
ncbi:MAG: FAD:protein FMN transferase [Planctomycetota bacterium]